MDNLSVAKQKWNLAHIFLITTLVLTNIHCLCHTGIHCKTIAAQSRAINLRTWFTWLNFCASTFFVSFFYWIIFSFVESLSVKLCFLTMFRDLKVISKLFACSLLVLCSIIHTGSSRRSPFNDAWIPDPTTRKRIIVYSKYLCSQKSSIFSAIGPALSDDELGAAKSTPVASPQPNSAPLDLKAGSRNFYAFTVFRQV